MEGEEPFVFLGCPTHTRAIDVGSAIGLLALPSRSVRCFPRSHKTSILPQGFNHLLAEALNFRDEGRGFTHFAMIHADVEPEPYWLDTLMQVMGETGADVVSAVVPIKDRFGLTSTGSVAPDGPKDLVRRLTLREAHALPKAFTAADLPWEGHRLVLNTGLMLCDLRRPWFEAGADGRLPVRFRFETEIVRQRGRYFANAEPEDWLFSRDVQDLGAKLAATTAVKVTHWDGGTPYRSDERGQWETDHAYLDIVEMGTFSRSWRFPDDVPGWLTEAEGRCLARHAKGKDVLEIGSWQGRSTICMAQTANAVVAVDPLDSRATLQDPIPTRHLLDANVERYGVGDRVVVCQGTSEDVVPTLSEKFDLCFIDGAHDYESVARDARLASSVLKGGGLLAFHDYRVRPGDDGRWDPGVTRAVDELVAAGGGLLGCWGTVAVVRPPAALAA